MELLLLETNLAAISILDTFESLIWTDRYTASGDFEISTPVNKELISILKEDRYLMLNSSEHLMIIESLGISSNSESGNKLVTRGRSIESILERRIIWTQTILSGNFQSEIQRILNENAINCSNTDRIIPELIFETSTDPNITGLTIEGQYTGDNLYKVISSACLSRNIGFKITLSTSGKFVFKLYSGTDRSYMQSTNPYIIFSPKFDNIINGEYFENKAPLKTVSLVAGEGEGSNRKTVIVNAAGGAGSGLSRREMFSDAKDISSVTSNGTLSEAAYQALLIERGSEDLSWNTFYKSFEGQVDSSSMYNYGNDFSMGDIVQVSNEYGKDARSRITELIHSQDASGIKIYPSFSTIS